MAVAPGLVSTSVRRRSIAKVAVVLALALSASMLTMAGSATAGGPPTSDAGDIGPGETLSTVQGPPQNPVDPSDPFAIGLRNVTSSQTFAGFIEEEPCDGSQEGDPLCSTPRLGGRAGDFQFSPSGGGEALARTHARPVTVARLFYDATLVAQADGVRIFYQKEAGGPVERLRRCGEGRRTECFLTKRLRSGDQLVKVPLKDDPRVTRG